MPQRWRCGWIRAAKTALGKGPEQQSAADIAGGVLHDGEIEGLGLGPVMGDVVEVFGVGGNLLKQTPSGLDVGEVLFAWILAATRAKQAMSAPDAFQGAVAESKIELANEATCAEGRQLLAERDDLLLDLSRGFARLAMGCAGECDPATRTLLLIAT